jgi:hypothetical protein
MLNGKITLALITIFIFTIYPTFIKAQCVGSGGIVSSGSGALGTPATLDPDSDGDIVEGGTTFSGCTGELAQFEPLTNTSGCSTCQVPWTPLKNSDIPSDLWSGSGCGNTDIVGDTTTVTNTFAYFTIIDPDGTCDSGDEIIVFRLRISNNFSGNFSFDFLVSNDGLTGLDDTDGFVCCSKVTNAGFEYEVQLKTGGGSGVNVIDIDGVVGSDNCGGSPDPCISYTVAAAAQKSLPCGSACDCRSAGGNPVFLTYFIKLSDVGVDCSTYTNLSFVPVTSSSGNPVISSCTSVADVGGAADLTQALLDCPDCNGVSYSGCTTTESEQGCILSCTAQSNSFSSALPVTLTNISGVATPSFNLIRWQTSAEVNTSHFGIERSLNGTDGFQALGDIPAWGNESSGAHYTFEDREFFPIAYYRIKFVDYDGSFSYSNTVVVQRTSKQLTINKIFTRFGVSTTIQYSTPSTARSVDIIVSDISGRIIKQERNLPGGDLQSFDIQSHNFAKGIYIVSISDGYSLVSEKLIF